MLDGHELSMNPYGYIVNIVSNFKCRIFKEVNIEQYITRSYAIPKYYHNQLIAKYVGIVMQYIVDIYLFL